eukprot:m.27568 g.27568  ORF g.27568 m.27568 type:complete len:615 (-) comp5956_c0_seq1:232-2076(-)
MSLLNHPLTVVDDLFLNFLQEGNDPSTFALSENMIEDMVSRRTLIPSLNDVDRMHLAPGSLVRYRCMIQDTHNLEVYMDVYEVASEDEITELRTSRYREENYIHENTPVNLDSPKTVLKSRHPLHCVPVPGESPWVLLGFEDQAEMNHELVSNDINITSPLKRANIDSDEEGDDDDDDEEGENQDQERKQKAMDKAKDARIPISMATPIKKRKTRQALSTGTDNGDIAQDYKRSFPLEQAQAPPALVKVYMDEVPFKIHDIIEVFGIYMNTPELQQVESDFCIGTILPTPSELPRIHALHIAPLTHVNPNLPSPLEDNLIKSTLLECALETRVLLKDILTVLLWGDELVAEYLVLHLTSAVRHRSKDNTLVLGHLPLNIYGFMGKHSKIPERLKGFIEAITTCSNVFEMTIRNLNSTTMNPKKNYNTDRLEAGALQLCKGTHLTLDEVVMDEGDLVDRGVKNLMALQHLLQAQQVLFEFDHMAPIPFNLDVQLLVLSEGKSLLPVPVKLKLEPTFAAMKPVHVTDDEQRQIRDYLVLAKHSPYTIPEEVQDAISEDFSKRRQTEKNLQGDSLHRMLNLARALSLSKGVTELTADLWSEAQELDATIMMRMSEAN